MELQNAWLDSPIKRALQWQHAIIAYLHLAALERSTASADTTGLIQNQSASLFHAIQHSDILQTFSSMQDGHQPESQDQTFSPAVAVCLRLAEPGQCQILGQYPAQFTSHVHTVSQYKLMILSEKCWQRDRAKPNHPIAPA